MRSIALRRAVVVSHAPGASGSPGRGPPDGGLEHGLLGGVLGELEVADVAHERGHHTWPLLADDTGELGVVHRQPSNSTSGRTSTEP